MIDYKRKLKNFGPLEALVLSSLAYVVIMLMWTASTRSAVVQKANDIKANHKLVVEFINNQVNECSSNEEDLNNALNENIIFGAGLDVFEKEPIDKKNPLLKNNKVLLSPHSATFTNECKSRMSLETTKNIIDFFSNKIDKSMIVKL